MGERRGHIKPDAGVTAILFDCLRRQVDASIAPGARIQWDFTDAEPWYLEIDNGAAAVAPGHIEHPDLTFRCRFDDWLDLAAGRIEPWRALLLRKIRPRGKLRMLAQAPKLFG